MRHVWSPQAETEPFSKIREDEELAGFHGWVNYPACPRPRVQVQPLRELADTWRNQVSDLDSDLALAAKQCAADLDTILDQLEGGKSV